MTLAGYNWETVDKLRNAIGKKIPTEMAKQHEIFIKGCQENSDLSKEEAEKIWDLFVPFQGYGFNKAHAASYGIVSYQTAYLKAHYPVEYMTALLTAESNDTDKVVEGINECRRMGIVVLPPDINNSMAGFSIEPNEKSLENKAIRFGLNAVKNVGDAALEEIFKGRKEAGKFTNFCDFYLRVNGQKVNRKVLESLIKAGAMDAFGKRSALLAALDLNRQKCDLIIKQKSQGQTSLFGESSGAQTTVPKDDLPNIDEFSKTDLMSLEKNLLGFYLTENPLSTKLALLSIEADCCLGEIDQDNFTPQQRIKVGGMITSLRVVMTKKGNSEMAFATLEDGTGKIELVIFPKIYSQFKNIWEKDHVVLIEGKLDRREEEMLTLIVDRGELLSESDAAKYDFVIRVPKGISAKKLMELNLLLKNNPGEEMGLLIFENSEGGPKKLVLNFGVAYSDKIEQEIKRILNN
jgi:DNA polymerase-3 subunit alpha